MVVGILYSVMLPVVREMLPILFPWISVNHRVPSEPAVIAKYKGPTGGVVVVGDNDVVVTELVKVEGVEVIVSNVVVIVEVNTDVEVTVERDVTVIVFVQLIGRINKIINKINNIFFI